MQSAKSKVYGPFQLAQKMGSDGVQFLSLPYDDVHDSQLMISVTDNAAQAINTISSVTAVPNTSYGIVTVELAIWGFVLGFATLIKRQVITGNYNAMNLYLGSEDAYDRISFRGRVFIGGYPGIPNDEVYNVPLSIEANVHVQPRSL